MKEIGQNVQRILKELPGGVQLVGAAKSAQPEEILEAVEAGVKIIGENYVREAEKAYQVVGDRARWHLIGHLQKNKVTKAVKLFDLIETVDSPAIAGEIDTRCARLGRIMPVLIEVNSGREKQKTGVFPEDVVRLAGEISTFKNLKLMGMMTMGPRSGNPEDSRPCFVETKKIFEKIKRLDSPGVEMKYLSMGMSDSYPVAIDEGANLVRIGTKIFGDREEGATGPVRLENQ
ncbi:MAG: YggS family pyridoxal phosphate-dependent enzyme [Dehalococcoidales bacterium]